MATKIEKALYRNFGTHGVKRFLQEKSRLNIVMAPWEDLSNEASATFDSCEILSINVVNNDPEDLNLPWDIVGFGSEQLENGMWQFCLHCSGIEYVFKANWPVIKFNL
jgi:hypothetical protein